MKTVAFEQSLNGKQSRKTYNEEHEKQEKVKFMFKF